MRDIVIKKASSRFVAAAGIIVLLIFIAAMKHPQQKKAYTYLALGDSYTIGEQVKEQENFPNQTVALLREQGFAFKAPSIIAKTGWTTDELEAGIKRANLQHHYDFVTLLIGVNNQYRGRAVDDYIPQLESLLKKALSYTSNDSSRVIVLSIPDWSVTPFAEGRDRKYIAEQIDVYNAAKKQVAGKYKVHYIDITSSTRETIYDSGLLTNDGLHPSQKEYAKWAKKIAAVISSGL
ncbi:MAG TPA: SGNH/GDSL hydrolase family protein [Chitinophagaceae bacterium]|nr:SGNH/GDSL hydrolase family protein [Chitinophagaceae bacterium]